MQGERDHLLAGWQSDDPADGAEQFSEGEDRILDQIRCGQLLRRYEDSLHAGRSSGAGPGARDDKKISTLAWVEDLRGARGGGHNAAGCEPEREGNWRGRHAE